MKEKKISDFFNVPYRTLKTWAKEEVNYLQGKEAWRFKLLEKLDAIMILEKKAHEKILNLFTKEELNVLLSCIFKSDYFPLLEVEAGFNLKETIKQIILYECEDEKLQKALLLKARELCEFEIYVLFSLLEKAHNKAQAFAEEKTETEEEKEYAQADWEKVLEIFKNLF